MMRFRLIASRAVVSDLFIALVLVRTGSARKG